MSMMPGLAMVMIALGPSAAKPPSVSPWLVVMQPALIGFGYDAEASRDCIKWPSAVDRSLIQSGESSSLVEWLSPEDSRFSRMAITHGRANAIFDLRQDRDRVCAGLSQDRLEAMGVHYTTPIWKWPEHV